MKKLHDIDITTIQNTKQAKMYYFYHGHSYKEQNEWMKSGGRKKSYLLKERSIKKTPTKVPQCSDSTNNKGNNDFNNIVILKICQYLRLHMKIICCRFYIKNTFYFLRYGHLRYVKNFFKD